MAKSVCKTNIKSALRKAYDGGRVPVNDEWTVWFGPNNGGMFCDGSVHLGNAEDTVHLWTNYGGCCSMTETIECCTDNLIKQYKDFMNDDREYRLVFKNLITGKYVESKMRTKLRLPKYEFEEHAWRAFKVQNPLEMMRDYALVKYWAA